MLAGLVGDIAVGIFNCFSGPVNSGMGNALFRRICG